MIRKYRRDILALLLLFFAGIFACILLLNSHNGKRVKVSVAGSYYDSYDLDRDAEIVIYGKDKGENTLVIKNGEAYVKKASCPDGLCIKMGHIKLAGQSVICLPNQVVISVEDNKTAEDEADVFIGN